MVKKVVRRIEIMVVKRDTMIAMNMRNRMNSRKQ